MSDRVWHKGPPRFTGWWNASECRDDEIWRWWNGENWSELATPFMSAGTAAHQARKPRPQGQIKWSDYWPENARVPRLDPTGGHWTFNDGVDPEYAGEIDLAFRDGDFVSASRGRQYWDWAIRGNGGDILAWRPAA